MTSEIQKPGYYLRTFDRDIFLTEEQKRVLYMAMDSDAEYFDMKDGHRIMMNQVKEIIPATEYDKSPSGGHYCSKHTKNFVPRGKVCGYC